MGFLLGGSCSPCCGGPVCPTFENPPDSIRVALEYRGHWKAASSLDFNAATDAARTHYEVMKLGKQAVTDFSLTVYSTAATLVTFSILEGTFDLVVASQTSTRIVYTYVSPRGFHLNYVMTRARANPSETVTADFRIYGGPEIRTLQKSGSTPATAGELAGADWNAGATECPGYRETVAAGGGFLYPNLLKRYRSGGMSSHVGPKFTAYSSACNNTGLGPGTDGWPNITTIGYCPEYDRLSVSASQYASWQTVPYDSTTLSTLSGLSSPLDFVVGTLSPFWPAATKSLSDHQADTAGQNVPVLKAYSGETWLVAQGLPLLVTPEPMRFFAEKYEITTLAGVWSSNLVDLFLRA